MSSRYSGARWPACLTTVLERANPARTRSRGPVRTTEMSHIGADRRKGRGNPMGMLNRMKDMKDMAEAAPGMVAQAQQLGAQAQQMAAAQLAAYQTLAAQAAGAQLRGAEAEADFEPIAGVPIEAFAAVSKGVAAFGYDPARLPEIAASRGIQVAAWQTAHQGWNDRIKRNRAVAQRFNQLYRAS
jgi:hypothetical protein